MVDLSDGTGWDNLVNIILTLTIATTTTTVTTRGGLDEVFVRGHGVFFRIVEAGNIGLSWKTARGVVGEA